LAQLKLRAADVFEEIPDARRIVAFRNLLAHGYADLDDVRVWSIVETDLRTTLDDLEGLLEAEAI